MAIHGKWISQGWRQHGETGNIVLLTTCSFLHPQRGKLKRVHSVLPPYFVVLDDLSVDGFVESCFSWHRSLTGSSCKANLSNFSLLSQTPHCVMSFVRVQITRSSALLNSQIKSKAESNSQLWKGCEWKVSISSAVSSTPGWVSGPLPNLEYAAFCCEGAVTNCTVSWRPKKLRMNQWTQEDWTLKIQVLNTWASAGDNNCVQLSFFRPNTTQPGSSPNTMTWKEYQIRVRT